MARKVGRKYDPYDVALEFPSKLIPGLTNKPFLGTLESSLNSKK